MLPQYCIYFLSYRWTTGANETLFAVDTFLVYFAFGLAAAYYTTMVIVSQMSKSPIQWGSATVVIVAPMFMCVEVVSKEYNLADQRLALRMYLVWLAINYLHFFVGVCLDLSRALSVPIFTIPSGKAKNDRT